MMETAFWLVIALSFTISYALARSILLKEAKHKYCSNRTDMRTFLVAGVLGGLLMIYPSLIAAFVVGYPIGMVLGAKTSAIIGYGDSGGVAGFLLGIGSTIIFGNVFGVIAGKAVGNAINKSRARECTT